MNICDVFLSIEMTSGSCILWPCGILRAFLEKFNILPECPIKSVTFVLNCVTVSSW